MSCHGLVEVSRQEHKNDRRNSCEKETESSNGNDINILQVILDKINGSGITNRCNEHINSILYIELKALTPTDADQANGSKQSNENTRNI